ncbi:hypothetical protein UlMin_036686 [Ulmus minor]
MAFDLEKQVKMAFIIDHFELTIDLYSQVISLNPKNAELYVDRAQVNIKLSSFTEVVADANRVIELEPSNSKAYLWKGTACIKLEEYHTAKTFFEIGASLETGELTKHSIDSTSTPNVSTKEVQPVETVNDQPNHVTVPPTKPKYKHDFYQKPEEVVLTIFAKGKPTKQCCCRLCFVCCLQLSISIDVPGRDVYHYQPCLFGKVMNLTSYFLENQRPSYPSSKPRRVDWDKLEAKVTKEQKLQGYSIISPTWEFPEL